MLLGIPHALWSRLASTMFVHNVIYACIDSDKHADVIAENKSSLHASCMMQLMSHTAKYYLRSPVVLMLRKEFWVHASNCH